MLIDKKGIKMIKLKKSIQILVLLVIFLSVTGMKSVSFTDITEDRASFEIIQEFFDRGLTKGYPDGTFRPDQGVSRAEFISFVNRTFHFDFSEVTLEFTDIKGTEWFLNDLHIAVGQGYIAGYPDGTFRPNRPVTRQEAAVILQRILNYELIEFTPTDEHMEPWAKESIHIMMSNGVILPRKNGFQGNREMTREEMAISLVSAVHKEEAKAAEEEDKDEKDTVSKENASTGSASSTESDKNITSPPADVVYSLDRAVSGLERALAGENSYARALEEHQLDIIQSVKETIVLYLADYSYNFEADKKQVRTQVNKLSAKEQEALKHAVQASIPLEYIDTVQDFFEGN